MSWIAGLAMLAWAADPADAPPDPPAADWGREGPGQRLDPFRDKQLDKMMRRVVPAIERAAGRPFVTPPVVELATEEVFDAMLREETALVYAAVHRDTPAALRDRLVAEAKAGIQPGLLGKYGMFEDKLFLCPDNLRDAAAELRASSLSDVVTLVLAHELGHALHDQYADLAELVRVIPDRDAWWALQSTSEGLANFIEGRVADELGLTGLYDQMNRWQGWTDDGPLRPEAFRIWSHYGLGGAMMRHHFATGGLDRVWEVARHPPERTRAVFRPEAWPADRADPSLDFAAVLRGTEQLVTRGDWLLSISPLGEAPLWAEAYGAGSPERVDDVLEHLAEAWSLEGVRPDRQAQIRVLVFDSPEGARSYLALLEDHDEGLADRLGTHLSREVEVVTKPFDQVAGDLAARRTSKVIGLGGTALERDSAWVVRGNTLVVVLTEDFRPGLRLGWTIESVFARLDAARRGDPLPPVERP